MRHTGNFFKRILPASIKSATRDFYFDVLDFADSLLNREKHLTPPRKLIHRVGGGDFETIGIDLVNKLIQIGRLKQTDSVLDVGCGVGRVAIALTEYLTPEAKYRGFDIDPEMVKWNINNITPKYPNFLFSHADIYNGSYNSKGKYKASEYQFPYEDGFFDFVFLTSVFTHMLAGDMKHYLSEISRILKGQGRCMITYFLINDEYYKNKELGISKLNMMFNHNGYYSVHKERPEDAIAYQETEIRLLFATNNLTIVEPIYYGSWSGRSNVNDFQDMILAIKS